jgi:hypothetical protein
MTTNSPSPLHTRAILSAEERSMLAIAAKQQTQQPFDQVAQATGLASELLRKLVRDGVLSGVAPVRQMAGTCDFEQAQQIAERLDVARRRVEGKGILVADAAEKYGFSRDTIYTWLKAEWVRQEGTTASGKTLVNESDVAFARALADLIGHRQGKPIFPTNRPSGRPPKK